MKSLGNSVLLTASLLLCQAIAVPLSTQEISQADIDSGKALTDYSKTAFDNAMARLDKSDTGCTKDNVKIRKEWSSFDDFAVLHVAFTPYVHNSATFLTFHRYFLKTYEQRLEDQCGYTGTIPYWEWGLDCDDIDKSPLWDGSETSLGSNGEFIANKPNPMSMFGAKAGTGGGCVKKGPFANYTVNLGPVSAAKPLGYNPRCIKRDLNSDICAKWASLGNTTLTIRDGSDVEIFQALLQGDFRYKQASRLGMAVHGGGHFTIGGDPGGDFYFSPLEPGGIAGTGTMMNMPASRNVTLDDTLDFSPMNPKREIRELIDTISGPFCYVYEYPWHDVSPQHQEAVQSFFAKHYPDAIDPVQDLSSADYQDQLIGDMFHDWNTKDKPQVPKISQPQIQMQFFSNVHCVTNSNPFNNGSTSDVDAASQDPSNDSNSESDINDAGLLMATFPWAAGPEAATEPAQTEASHEKPVDAGPWKDQTEFAKHYAEQNTQILIFLARKYLYNANRIEPWSPKHDGEPSVSIADIKKTPSAPGYLMEAMLKAMYG
ncbi:hypothetical protein PG997_000545 [Apiospora hydei]|uniref:Tyrosinase copper-binding domain-containing protein n=1 Tax=Apiospora hydei TaxID=1337664 RepID=A0ABR1XAY1_9PEZI